MTTPPQYRDDIDQTMARAFAPFGGSVVGGGRTLKHEQLRILGITPSLLEPGEIAVDLFAGGGGWSEGFQQATGVPPAIAINHCKEAIEMHERNHPESEHYHEDVFEVDPFTATRGRRVGWLHLSPDCTHFSRAKGSVPKSKKIRGLAWVGVKWAAAVKPRIISLENVAEFTTWGPLDAEGHPIKAMQGETFRLFVTRLEALGYVVEWKVLNAADYGAPTSRKRLFLIARRDGKPIRWPKATHGPGREYPYRTAAECIDWSIPAPSIFSRKKPLADATMRRIAEGLRRYVINAKRPFIVNLTHGGRLENLDEPMKTVTCANRSEKAIVVPSLIQTGYGERPGQKPRVLDLQAPLGTVVADGQKHGLVEAFLLKHFGGVVGQEMEKPLGTITAKDHHALGVAHLQKLYGTSVGSEVDAPAPTITGGGNHLALLTAFLAKYYGADKHGQGVDEPLHTIPTVDRFGLVTVTIDGELYSIVDIGMRMLQPRELARAQGFPDSYVLTGNKTQQVERIGNSVPPAFPRALVAANLGNVEDEEAAA